MLYHFLSTVPHKNKRQSRHSKTKVVMISSRPSPALCCLRPTDSRNLHQIISPPYGWFTNIAFSDTRSRLNKYLFPPATCFESNVPRPLLLKVCNSLGCIGYFGSLADILISDSIRQYNSEDSLCYNPLGDFEPSYHVSLR